LRRKVKKDKREIMLRSDLSLRRVNPREARRMMQRMGMSMDSVPEVTQVIVKTATKDIIIDEPEVAILNMQGQRVYQVMGGRVTEKAVVVEKKLIIPDEDVQLVAGQTGKSVEEVRKALEESGGDLAKAILLLQSG
jgi:nascent polypeptide-associated complex subunit alpha